MVTVPVAAVGTLPLTYSCPVGVPLVPMSIRLFVVSADRMVAALEFCIWKAVVELVESAKVAAPLTVRLLLNVLFPAKVWVVVLTKPG